MTDTSVAYLQDMETIIKQLASPVVFAVLSVCLWLFYGIHGATRSRGGLIRGGGHSWWQRRWQPGSDEPSMSALLICLLMQLLLLYAQKQCSNLTQQAIDRHGTEFIFVLQWLPGKCFDDTPCNTSNFKPYWTIRGLWMEDTYCRAHPQIYNHLDKLDVNQMNELWPTAIVNRSAVDNWNYQWLKYGTCGRRHYAVNSIRKYFQRVLELYKRINLDDILKSNKLTPKKSGLYKRADFEKALGKRLDDVHITLVCRTINGVSVLEEIRICFDYTFALRDCDETTPCSANVLYPTPRGSRPRSETTGSGYPA